MIEKLPYYYRKSAVVQELYKAVKMLFDKVTKQLSDEEKELFLMTAADLSLHEKDAGLVGISADTETKRSRVITRLQGNGLLTKRELEKLITLYEESGCTIYEDFSHYTIRIIFSNMVGKPHNIEQIMAAVDEVKPAHIKVIYEFLKNTWNAARTKFTSWGNARICTWDGIQYADGKTWLYCDKTHYDMRLRTWTAVKSGIPTWRKAKNHAWNNVRKQKTEQVYLQTNNANAYLLYKDGEYYAQLI